jgi:hypothetical protein
MEVEARAVAAGTKEAAVVEAVAGSKALQDTYDEQEVGGS